MSDDRQHIEYHIRRLTDENMMLKSEISKYEKKIMDYKFLIDRNEKKIAYSRSKLKNSH